MLPNELLERIATAYEGKISATERQALEKELHALPNGQTEATAYRQLWDGFSALRSQDFRAEIKQWEAEAADLDEEELAEWYITNALHPDHQNRLAERQKSDPDFAEKLSKQQQLTDGFDALKTESFREQLSTWEAEQTPLKVRQLRPKWLLSLAVAASFLLLFALGGNWYSQNNYSNTALAGKYYKIAPTGNTLGAETERAAFLKSFDEAHQALNAGEYPVAVRTFEQLATQAPPASFSDDDLQYYQDNIEWNLILAQLGAGNTIGNFDQRLDRIVQDPSHTYHQQAMALQQDLGAFWRW